MGHVLAFAMVSNLEEKRHGRGNTQVFSSDSRHFDIQQ